MVDLQAFNTDGFDVTGKNVHMHDLNIWNDDDCIAVKDGSENMLFERINASGLGLVIGSIGASRVNNITFRNSYMYHTFKGIYMKTRWSDSGPVGESASITNILYENITMFEPEVSSPYSGSIDSLLLSLSLYLSLLFLLPPHPSFFNFSYSNSPFGLDPRNRRGSPARWRGRWCPKPSAWPRASRLGRTSRSVTFSLNLRFSRLVSF